MKKVLIITIAVIAVATIVMLAINNKTTNNTEATQTSSTGSFTQISQDEAKEMMKKDDGHIVVDVRRIDEFESGHIPDAICIPNESIVSEKPKELPSLNQVILVYCRTGRRSKEAAQKLYDIGYTNVYEFGGIVDWTGEVVTDE